MTIAGYNIHVRLEAVDDKGRIVQAAMATRNVTGSDAPTEKLRRVFNSEAEQCADVAQTAGWEDIPTDLPPPLDCVDCGAALMVSALRCRPCAVRPFAAELRVSAAQACENPPPGCGCAGCSYAAELNKAKS